VYEAGVPVLDSYLNADVYSLPAPPQYSDRTNQIGKARQCSVIERKAIYVLFIESHPKTRITTKI
jgi:hypothetical protein